MREEACYVISHGWSKLSREGGLTVCIGQFDRRQLVTSSFGFRYKIWKDLMSFFNWLKIAQDIKTRFSTKKSITWWKKHFFCVYKNDYLPKKFEIGYLTIKNGLFEVKRHATRLKTEEFSFQNRQFWTKNALNIWLKKVNNRYFLIKTSNLIPKL